MNDKTHDHPSQQLLTEYGLGKLDPDASHLIEIHVAECAQCGDTLLHLHDDTFVNLIRRSDAVEIPAEDRTEQADQKQAASVSMGATVGEVSAQTVGEFELPAALADHPRYRIDELLGRGGMGDVYRAEHIVMNRPVALKVINRELVKNPQAVERFRREVHAAARLSHPNIVTAHDAEQAGDLHFLVMEFVDGTDLSHLVEQRETVSVSEACDYIRQAALGLQQAHEQGMVHRDIKPHNLMVTADGTVKILDFGLAGFATESALIQAEQNAEAGEDSVPLHLTSIGTVMGTPDYIAPEQAKDAHSADIRSDIYSLGCTLYFLLAGEPPHKADSVVEKLQAHAKEEPLAIESVRVDIPDHLADVIKRMMAKDPAERFQTPQEVADALAPFVDQHRTSTPVGTPASGFGGRQRWMVGIGVLAVLLSALAGIIYVETDKGTLVVESADENVEVRIYYVNEEDRNAEGNLKINMTFIDQVTGSKVIRLHAGTYRLFLAEKDNSFQLNQSGFTLRRGKKVIAKVTRTESKKVEESLKGRTPQQLNDPDQITEVGRYAGHNAIVTRVVFAPDNRHVLSVSDDQTVQYWDFFTGELVHKFQGGGMLRAAAVSPQNELAATGGAQRIVHLWNLKTGEPAGQITGHNDRVQAIQFLPDGRRLASTSGDRTLRIWDLETKQEIRQFRTDQSYCYGLAVSPNGKWIACHSANATLIVNTDTWEERRLPRESNGLAFSPDSTTLSIAQTLWDAERGEQVGSFSGQADGIHSVHFTPDGRFVLYGSDNDKSLRLWEVKTGREVARAECKSFVTTHVALSPDGRHVASGGGIGPNFTRDGDHIIRCWRLPKNVTPYKGTADELVGHGNRATPELREKLTELVAAARQASTAEEWDKVLKEHAPLLASVTDEFTEGESEQFGEAELAKFREGGRMFVELLAGLPDDVNEDLLRAGYLKWKFTELDEPRQTAMREALTTFFSATDKMGFPAGLKDQVPKMLASGDVGFGVLDTTGGQGVVWYFLMPDAPIPILFPLLSVPQEGEPKDFPLSQSVYQQIGELVEKPYSQVPAPPVAKPEIQQALNELVAAVRKVSTYEEWEQVLKEHAPLLSVMGESINSASKQFGEAEKALMREGGRMFIELLARLPDDVHEDLLKTGYLKWKFTDLDEPRQQAMREALTTFFAAADKLEFPTGLKDRVPKMLASGDVGFAVVNTSKGQGVLWYLNMPDAPIPILFPLLGVPQEGEAKDFPLSQSVYKQIGELEDKPYSTLPSIERTQSDAEDGSNWRSLFDGKTTDGWYPIRSDTSNRPEWRVEDGWLIGTTRSHLLSAETFDNFELTLEWKMEPQGNGGVFYRIPPAAATRSSTG